MSRTAMTPTELVQDLAKVMAGLQVARSISTVPFGAALEPYDRLHSSLIGLGWGRPEDFEYEIRKALGLPAVTSIDVPGISPAAKGGGAPSSEDPEEGP
jgi:hypothetical protein